MPDSEIIVSGPEMAAMIGSIAASIAGEFGSCTNDLTIIGLQRRGVPLAERIAAELQKITGAAVPVGKLDISMYRDDIGMRKALPIIHETDIPFNIEGKIVILADDVLQAGRSIRAALDAITNFGRPNITRLAILIDRGQHEFPIAPDYTGKFYSHNLSFKIRVCWTEIDGVDRVELEKNF